MKKIFMILLSALLCASGFLFTSCSGEDGEDGLSATELILKETGNKWYQYKDISASDGTVTADNSGSTVSLGTIYLKYDTSSDELVVAAVGDSFYAKNTKSLTRSKWAASAVALRIAGKIETQSSDPTNGKTCLTDISSWGNFTAETLITKLFE